MRLDCIDTVVYSFNKKIHIIAPPFTDICKPPVVFSKRCIILVCNLIRGIRIKIIVEVDAVDIIPPDDIRYDFYDKLTDLR